MMNGIQFITDEKGKKKSVVIDLDRYGKLWDDFYDQLLAEQRAQEPKISLEEVTRRLKEKGKLRG